VPDDLLRFVSGPMPYSTGWLWLGLLLLFIVVAWYTGIFVWTLPSDRLRSFPVVRSWHARWLRRRFARSVRSIGVRLRSGDLTAAEAGALMSRTLRSFLHHATGKRAQYMHVDEIRSGDLAPAAPLFTALNDAQFNTASSVDLAEIGSATEELIRTWP
jgi:hypothetical protein